jgi:serine protease Do
MRTANLRVLAVLVGAVVVCSVACVLWLPIVAPRALAAERGAPNGERLAELAKLDHMSALFAEVARTVKPAVVEVRVVKKVSMQQMPDMDDFLRRFFGQRGSPFPGPGDQSPRPSRPPREFFQRGLGSGVIVDARKGHVLTNHHVVAGADELQVVLADGRSFKTQWVRTDPQTDLAVIRIEGTNLVEAPLGDSDRMAVGDWVLAIGSPEGLPQTVTAGIISAKGRTTGEAHAYQNFLQTDAAINHGNFGGPLVNTRGEVIGINTAIVSQSGGNEGIGFSIPSNMARNIMTQLIDAGKVTRGYLGVSIQGVDEKLARSFHLPNTKGALVSSVVPGGPAEKAGLKPGDFIVSVETKPVESVNDLRNRVAGVQPGKTVAVEYYRDGKKAAVNVKIDHQPADMRGEPAGGTGEGKPGAFGLEVRTPTEELARQYGYKETPGGVLVTAVTPGSPADREGLREGMVITQVQGKAVASAEEFERMASGKEAEKGIRLLVSDPAGATRFVFLAPQKQQQQSGAGNPHP